MKMESSMPCTFLFISLFLLVHFHGVHSTQIPVVPDHDLTHMIFFHQQDLKPGNSIPLYFPTKVPAKTPKFLPKTVSDSIPFSLSRLDSVLKTLGIQPNSPHAKAMAETLVHCHKPPIKGESKFCFTSLESMLATLRLQFGSGSYPKLLTTSERVRYHRLQMFKVLEDPKEIRAPHAMACHPVPYPYAVFYCHGHKGSNRLYELHMETERDEERVRVRVLGICHMDTSDWDPNHLAFRMTGTRPGEGPVCHVAPPDTLVWVPESDSKLNRSNTVV